MQISRLWWALVLRGILAILLGAAAFSWPRLTVQVLIQLFGIFALLDGICTVAFALTTHAFDEFRWPILAEGLLGMSIGFLALLRPFVAGRVVLFLIAVWGLVTGVLEITGAIALRKVIPREWLLGVGGCLSILLGVLLIAHPDEFTLLIIFLIGAYAMIAGLALILFGMRIRSFHRKQTKGLGAAA